ncbi:hypothetical protein [Actinomadura rugatobispora]|uniref:Uncharacterized protein n=1 Tax=Actinomadura rugatobispora TaxID=1994 RepID=A0ABW0ZSQ5_9ACTN
MLLGDKGRIIAVIPSAVTNAPGGPCGTGGGADIGWGAVIKADRAYYDVVLAELESAGDRLTAVLPRAAGVIRGE